MATRTHETLVAVSVSIETPEGRKRDFELTLGIVLDMKPERMNQMIDIMFKSLRDFLQQQVQP